MTAYVFNRRWQYTRISIYFYEGQLIPKYILLCVTTQRTGDRFFCFRLYKRENRIDNENMSKGMFYLYSCSTTTSSYLLQNWFFIFSHAIIRNNGITCFIFWLWLCVLMFQIFIFSFYIFVIFICVQLKSPAECFTIDSLSYRMPL